MSQWLISEDMIRVPYYWLIINSIIKGINIHIKLFYQKNTNYNKSKKKHLRNFIDILRYTDCTSNWIEETNHVPDLIFNFL